jgi:hypothetical protein
MGGLYCRSDVGFPEMTRLAVSLELPVIGDAEEPRLIEAEAVVVRQEQSEEEGEEAPFRLALFFTVLDEQAEEVLFHFLESLRDDDD